MTWGEVYDSALAGKKAASIKEVFDRGFWPESGSGIGSKSQLPVFIVGIPRSGSTLLESILEAHKDVSTIREDSVLAASISGLKEKEILLRKEFSDSGSWSDTSLFDENLNGTFGHAWRYLINSGANNITELMRSEAARITGATSPKRIVDKLLTNYRNIGIIHLLFPKAAIIHIRRDPRDTTLSLMKHNFAHPGLGWTLTDSGILQEYSLYLKTMYHFRKVLPVGRITEISYEALLTNPEPIVEKLFGRIGVKCDKNVLTRFHETSRPYILTPSFLQVREALNNRSAGVWRKYKHNPDYQAFLRMLKHIIDDASVNEIVPYFDTSDWIMELNTFV